MVIENNTFVDPIGPAIVLAATQGAVIRNNRIQAAAYVWRHPGAVIELHDSAGLVMEHNAVDDARDQTTAAVDVAPEIPAGATGLVIHDLQTKLAPNSVPVLDRRGK
jgi:hypothetical protein